MSQEEIKLQRVNFPDGKLMWEGWMRDGKGEGLQTFFYPNGQKSNQFVSVNGKTHGEVQWWDQEGRLIDIYEVVNGTGPHRTWYGNGKKRGVGQTRDGLLFGRAVLWDKDGKKLCTTFHIKGGEVKKQKYLAAMAIDPTLPPID